MRKLLVLFSSALNAEKSSPAARTAVFSGADTRKAAPYAVLQGTGYAKARVVSNKKYGLQ